MRLLLLRHGQTPANVLSQLDTALPGAPLTALGQSQAEAIPPAFSAENLADGTPGAGTPIGAIFVSTLLRTQQTAAPLASRIAVRPRVLDGLREVSAGGIEMLSDSESLGIYTSTAFAWTQGDLDLRMPHGSNGAGESGHEFFARYDSAIADIRDSGHSTVVAVSHGAAIRTWVAARCANTDSRFAGDHQLENTGMAVVETAGDDGWRLLAWHSAPVGGSKLNESESVDPIGESVQR